MFDFFVHRPTYRVIEYGASRYARVLELPDFKISLEATSLPRVPMYEQIKFMGSGKASAYIAGIPDYVRMLEYGCGQMNWNIAEFDLYRRTVEYPFMDTLIARTFRFAPLAK